MEKYFNLRKQDPPGIGQPTEWSLENLKDGVRYFYELEGHYPSSVEIDNFPYLTSERSILQQDEFKDHLVD